MAVRACPAPDIGTEGWGIVQDSAGVTYRLPPAFTERPGLEPYRHWSHAVDPSGSLTIGFSPSREHWSTLRRVPSPSMQEMTECVEGEEGDQILIQSWRTQGGIFRDGRRADLFEMLALVPVEPMVTLFVTGGGSDPAFQATLLAIARTVRVARAR
jgi:hypothetical protein